MFVNHLEAAAKRKLNQLYDLPPGLKPGSVELLGDGRFLVCAGPTRRVSKGPRKDTADLLSITHRVIVTKEEIEAEQARYEVELGKCHICGGTGEAFLSWHHTQGIKTRECPRCGGTGDAPVGEERRVHAGSESGDQEGGENARATAS